MSESLLQTAVGAAAIANISPHTLVTHNVASLCSSCAIITTSSGGADGGDGGVAAPGGRISSRTAAAAAAGTGDGEAQLQHHLRIVISTAMVDGRKKGVSGTVPLARLGMVAAASNQSG